MEWRAQSRRVTLTSCMDEMRHADKLSHTMSCAMSEDDDTRLKKTNKKITCTLTCQSVAFHVCWTSYRAVSPRTRNSKFSSWCSPTLSYHRHLKLYP